MVLKVVFVLFDESLSHDTLSLKNHAHGDPIYTLSLFPTYIATLIEYEVSKQSWSEVLPQLLQHSSRKTHNTDIHTYTHTHPIVSESTL